MLVTTKCRLQRLVCNFSKIDSNCRPEDSIPYRYLGLHNLLLLNHLC